jgi:hypothetical protein
MFIHRVILYLNFYNGLRGMICSYPQVADVMNDILRRDLTPVLSRTPLYPNMGAFRCGAFAFRWTCLYHT